MEKAKQAAEDINRRLSSSSSSFTSEVSQENFADNAPICDPNVQNNGQNSGKEKSSLHPDDLLELGAEGKKTLNICKYSPEQLLDIFQ